MAKNFTDFQGVTGSWTPADYPPGDNGGYLTGTTTTQATTGMYLVGYDKDEPHGERRYTVESVLLAAEGYHVGLENVDNISNEDLLDDTTFTGTATADDLVVKGDLFVLGEEVQLDTATFATSALAIENSGTTIGLTVTQTGPDGIARFNDGTQIVFDVADNGKIGINAEAKTNRALFVSGGDVEIVDDVHLGATIDGRHLSQDGGKLDNIMPYSDVTGIALSAVESRLQELATSAPEFANITPMRGFDLLEDGDDFKKPPTLSAFPAPGIGDYSIEKIKSVEYNADVTGDHSADIIYNDVPDGPWNGSDTTTYVKTTSAENVYNAAAVHSVNAEKLTDGHAKLSHVNVSDEFKVETPIQVVSGAGFASGITNDVNAGGTWLRFIDGVLVDTKPGIGAGQNDNPF